MPTPVTEVVDVPLSSTSTFDDPSTKDGKNFDSVVKTIRGVKGAQRVCWGRVIDDRNHLQVLIDWDSIEDHIAFTKSPPFEEFVGRFMVINEGADKKPEMFHCHFHPHPPVINDNATELVRISYPAAMSAEDMKKWEQNFAKFTENVLKPQGCKGASGWVVEEKEGDGEEKLKMWLGAFGWTSVEAHLAVMDSEVFKNNRPLLMELSPKSTLIQYIKFQGL